MFNELVRARVFRPKIGRRRTIIWLVVITLLFIALSAVLVHFLPNLEKFAKYGYLGVFVATLVGSATIIAPAPGLAVILSAAVIWNPIWVALVASIGGTLGEATGYWVGRGGRAFIAREYQKEYEEAERWMERYGGLAIFLFALVPVLIFDLAGIAAGALRFPFWKFLLFCWAGRVPRSFIEAYSGLGVSRLILPFIFK
jgi:uncharacterized membrane protein YdjX (TVP38/TMEM64 family)